MANTAAKKITYDNKPVQVESAIRDGTGLEIASNYLKIQGGGTSKSYTISATGYKTIAQVTSASQYWTVNGGNSHIRLKIEYSSLSSPASTATTTKLGEWVVDVVFSGINANMFAVSMNGNAGNNDGVLRYLAAYAPKSTSYGPKIAVANYSATSTYVKVTIISCTAGWELPASFGGDPGTTNYTRVGAWEIGRYNGTWSSSQIKASISGNCDGIAGSAWDSIRNDRHVGGATAAFVNGSTSYSIRSTRPCGIASDGKAYQLSTPGKAFKLPFVGGRAQNNFGLNNTLVQLYYEVRAIATSELTTQYVDNTAALTAGATYTGTGTLYAYKWVFVTHGSTDTTATTLTVGLPMYICGNLDSDGNFVPYNTVQTGQTISVPSGQGGFSAATNVTGYVYTFYITQNPTYRSGKYDTFLYFGRCDKQNNNFTYLINASAITLNSSGNITKIDGRTIQDTTYTLAGLGGVPTSRKINGYDLTADRTLNGADVKLTGYSKPSSTSAVAATDTINGAIGKLETALDNKIKRGSYERIEGTSSTHKDLNNYYTPGFYNVKGLYTDNCPSTGDKHYYLMVMPWDSNKWCAQVCISGNFTAQHMWVRTASNQTATTWNSWTEIANSSALSSYAPLASPALTGTPTAPTATAGTNTTQIATTAFVKTAIDALPEPMLFKGTLGTGGTITSLPTAAAANEGYVYKVITDGTYASQSAKVGDTFISTGSEWVLIPSGDEPSGTVTNVATGVGLTGGPVTSSGTIKAKLKSETNATYDSNSITNTQDRQYAVVPDKTNGYLSVNVPWENTHQTIKQDGVTGATVTRYASCSTLPIILAKKAYITNGTFTLEAGARVTVNFSSKNTANNPTLNINNTGAKNIYHNGAQITSGANKGLLYGACDFVYDGTQWLLIGNYVEVPNITISSSAPSGGSDGDIWIQY